ncbi:basic leucine zipper transcriptional factor ATF-like 3 isoform X1 [Melanotaenia boesemani]|uniref:basic leucine zipper transcriptional factor ATF-like 3 isoform X1 n=1 Tax=Melanotaenia boesemani TaxID=1250792 RepID=UPI001C03A6F1|nr:basic leucine zipper transcriptional factor ATF-like 3 isoform X1 [Melanotaenia boesemani]
MSDCSSSCSTPQMDTTTKQLFEAWGCSEDEDRRTTRREKNRVAAQKSRKRQTQRADLLHEACELLEQKNRKLRKEQVDFLSEEQHLLTEALRAHEPSCPIMHCSSASTSMQPDNIPALCEDRDPSPVFKVTASLWSSVQDQTLLSFSQDH